MKPSTPALQSIRPLDQLSECIQYMQYSLSIGQVGTEIRTVAELLGHSDVSTTMICTYVLKWRRVARRARWMRWHLIPEGPF